MDIFKYFKQKGISTLDASFYSRITLWDGWYRSNVRRFHAYRVYRGAGKYERCRRKSLGMAKKVCEDIADLLLNERVTVAIDNQTTDAYVKRVLDDANFSALGNHYQEWKAAVGTVAYVPYLTNMIVDDAGNVSSADVRLDYVLAKDIYPVSWESGKITEVVFTFRKYVGKDSYLLLQHHRLEKMTGPDGEDLGMQYVIRNSVVRDTRGSGTELTPQEWNEIPYFRGLAPTVETGTAEPQFVIDKLNIVNNADVTDPTNPMGIPVFANSLDVLAKIDLEYDSYASEFDLGRKRIFVAPEMLQTIDGDPVFDSTDTVFYQLPEDFFAKSGEAMHEVDMSLRVSEHEQAINNDLNLLSMKCGFGTQFYKFERGSVTTATQVISENSDLYRTIRKHELVLHEVLADLVRIIIRLGIASNVQGLNPDADIKIDFDDSIIIDTQAEREEDRKDVAIGAMRLEEYRAKWYGETEDVAAQRLPDISPGVIL